METTVEYCRVRVNRPLLPSDKERELDWFHVRWRLVPQQAIAMHRKYKGTNVESIVGGIVQLEPLRYITAQVVLLERVLAQINLTFATRINTSPIIEPWIVTNVIGQLCNDDIFTKPCEAEEKAEVTKARNAIKKQIKDFLCHPTKHTKHYAMLGAEGRKEISYTMACHF